jgi:hypothetical protein
MSTSHLHFVPSSHAVNPPSFSCQTRISNRRGHRGSAQRISPPPDFFPRPGRAGHCFRGARGGMLLALLGLLNPAQAPLWPAFFLRPGRAGRCFWPARVRWALFLADQGPGCAGRCFWGARGGATEATSLPAVAFPRPRVRCSSSL